MGCAGEFRRKLVIDFVEQIHPPSSWDEEESTEPSLGIKVISVHYTSCSIFNLLGVCEGDLPDLKSKDVSPLWLCYWSTIEEMQVSQSKPGSTVLFPVLHCYSSEVKAAESPQTDLWLSILEIIASCST